MLPSLTAAIDARLILPRSAHICPTCGKEAYLAGRAGCAQCRSAKPAVTYPEPPRVIPVRDVDADYWRSRREAYAR
jgi:hypothetical protein